jgi:hypothetical protein
VINSNLNEFTKDTTVYYFDYDIFEIIIPSQYDEPYNNTSNQCSWFSFEILKFKNEIIDCITNLNIVQLKNIYINALENGTNNRKNLGILPQGENIDEIKSNLNISLKSAIYGDPFILEMFSDIKNMIVKPHIKLYPYLDFLQEIGNLNENTMVLINRDGQSFVFLKYNNIFFIFDSHKRKIQLVNKQKLIDYILENNPTGFFYILWSIY